jgi:hypothetical protein
MLMIFVPYKLVGRSTDVSTRHQNPEEHHHHPHRRENLTSHNISCRSWSSGLWRRVRHVLRILVNHNAEYPINTAFRTDNKLYFFWTRYSGTNIKIILTHKMPAVVHFSGSLPPESFRTTLPGFSITVAWPALWPTCSSIHRFPGLKRLELSCPLTSICCRGHGCVCRFTSTAPLLLQLRCWGVGATLQGFRNRSLGTSGRPETTWPHSVRTCVCPVSEINILAPLDIVKQKILTSWSQYTLQISPNLARSRLHTKRCRKLLRFNEALVRVSDSSWRWFPGVFSWNKLRNTGLTAHARHRLSALRC